LKHNALRRLKDFRLANLSLASVLCVLITGLFASVGFALSNPNDERAVDLVKSRPDDFA